MPAAAHARRDGVPLRLRRPRRCRAHHERPSVSLRARRRSRSTCSYQPAESHSGLFGGNSNWRGPIWFPVNYLLIESLQKFHHYYGDDFKVECPTGSGKFITIDEVADELSRRLTRLFLRDENGRRPVLNQHPKLQTDPHFRDYVLFHEYFHGDNGRGVGASHQTGWTGLVAKLLQPRQAAVASDAVREPASGRVEQASAAVREGLAAG